MAVNKLGGGIVFEVFADADVDDFMTVCVDEAKKNRIQPALAA
jgi:hypothetical protein